MTWQSQNVKKPEMKLLVTAQALGAHTVPTDSASFQSGPPCTASFSQLTGASDSLELSQLPHRAVGMLVTCYSSSHTNRKPPTDLIHRIMQKMILGKITYSNKIMVPLLFPILSFI